MKWLLSFALPLLFRRLGENAGERPGALLFAVHAQRLMFMDPFGEVVAHVKVTLRESNGKEFSAESNDPREVAFSDLPKGTYELTATFPGFQTLSLSVKVPYHRQMQLPTNLLLMGEVIEVKQPDYQPDLVHRFSSGVKHLF
jgi:hypothetical protein